ncbi:MAG: hypothetical protein IPK60_05665 [Sandaracinaceae bacterium]|nr:hypothetical protein [Sandaracinaceae bacterium]
MTGTAKLTTALTVLLAMVSLGATIYMNLKRDRVTRILQSDDEFELDLRRPFEMRLGYGSSLGGMTVWTRNLDGSVTVASADLSEPFVDEVLPAARVNTPLVSMLGSMHAGDIPRRTVREGTQDGTQDGTQAILWFSQDGKAQVSYCDNALPDEVARLHELLVGFSRRREGDPEIRFSGEAQRTAGALWALQQQMP